MARWPIDTHLRGRLELQTRGLTHWLLRLCERDDVVGLGDGVSASDHATSFAVTEVDL